MPDEPGWLEAMGRDAYAELTGLEVAEARAGHAVVRLAVTPRILNGHGNVHGGAFFTLADYAAALASNLHGVPTMAVNGNINFLRAVRSGSLTATARTVKSGRRMKFIMVEIRDDAGVLAAVFQGGSITAPRKA